ncbi:MAG: response regulator [Chloroflexi bacterium]|nr:response regulator [Chloroflexota bacterium]
MSSGEKILIIDDEVNLLKTMALILSREGYDVMRAKDAATAIRILQTMTFNLVFLDLRLPDMSGLDLLASIHQRSPGVAVVILTGHPTIETEVAARRIGVRDFLKKPVDPIQILGCVRKILEEKNSLQRVQLQ